MDDGKIVESGKHNELIKKNGMYSKINEIQSKEYDVKHVFYGSAMRKAADDAVQFVQSIIAEKSPQTR